MEKFIERSKKNISTIGLKVSKNYFFYFEFFFELFFFEKSITLRYE